MFHASLTNQKRYGMLVSTACAPPPSLDAGLWRVSWQKCACKTILMFCFLQLGLFQIRVVTTLGPAPQWVGFVLSPVTWAFDLIFSSSTLPGHKIPVLLLATHMESGLMVCPEALSETGIKADIQNKEQHHHPYRTRKAIKG